MQLWEKRLPFVINFYQHRVNTCMFGFCICCYVIKKFRDVKEHRKLYITLRNRIKNQFSTHTIAKANNFNNDFINTRMSMDSIKTSPTFIMNYNCQDSRQGKHFSGTFLINSFPPPTLLEMTIVVSFPKCTLMNLT